MAGQARYVVGAADSDRTRLTTWMEMRTPDLARVAEPFMAAMLRRDVEANLGTLKALLEA